MSKKRKLRDLSRIAPSRDEELRLLESLRDKYVNPEGQRPTPIAAAILGAVFVEHKLEKQLRRKLARRDDKTWEGMLSDNGPFRSFSTKIIMGYALRIYDVDIRTNFNIVRNIRNAFAHSKKLIDFDHELVVAELKKIAIAKSPSLKLWRELKSLKDAQLMYISLCILLAGFLVKRESRALQASTRYLRRRNEALTRENETLRQRTETLELETETIERETKARNAEALTFLKSRLSPEQLQKVLRPRQSPGDPEEVDFDALESFLSSLKSDENKVSDFKSAASSDLLRLKKPEDRERR